MFYLQNPPVLVSSAHRRFHTGATPGSALRAESLVAEKRRDGTLEKRGEKWRNVEKWDSDDAQQGFSFGT